MVDILLCLAKFHWYGYVIILCVCVCVLLGGVLLKFFSRCKFLVAHLEYIMNLLLGGKQILQNCFSIPGTVSNFVF